MLVDTVEAEMVWGHGPIAGSPPEKRATSEMTGDLSTLTDQGNGLSNIKTCT